MDVLADDSNDEKKIQKLQKVTKRKLAKRRKVQEVKFREGVVARSLPRGTYTKTPMVSPIPTITAGPRPKYPVCTCF